MTTLYRLTQVQPIHRKHDTFAKDGRLLSQAIPIRTANRISKALILAQYKDLTDWRDDKGNWYHFDQLIIKCEEVAITQDGGEHVEKPSNDFSSVALVWTLWMTLRGKLATGLFFDPVDVDTMLLLLNAKREGNCSQALNNSNIEAFLGYLREV